MIQKEKSKPNPFADILAPSEKILWIWWRRQDLLAAFGLGPFSATVLGLFLALVVLMMFIMFRKEPFLNTLGLVLALLGLLALRLFLERVIKVILSGFSETLLPQTLSYAVTSDRLLFLRNKHVQALSLADVPSMTALPAKGSYGSLSFGPVFPVWNDLADVHQVKGIIEQAKKERIKELNL